MFSENFFLERELFKKSIINIILGPSHQSSCVPGFKLIFNNCCIFMAGEFQFGFKLEHIRRRKKHIKLFLLLITNCLETVHCIYSLSYSC